jgi:hypothetical protein
MLGHMIVFRSAMTRTGEMQNDRNTSPLRDAHRKSETQHSTSGASSQG